jgi:hypothetical protein
MHNLIHMHNPSKGDPPADNGDEDRFVKDGLGADMADDNEEVAAVKENNKHALCQGTRMHDHIAAAMWAQDQCVML